MLGAIVEIMFNALFDVEVRYATASVRFNVPSNLIDVGRGQLVGVASR